jgi:hypothetical protein
MRLQYADWSHGGRVGGIKWGRVRSLMKELDLFEGVPPNLVVSTGSHPQLQMDTLTLTHMVAAIAGLFGLPRLQQEA